MNSVQELYFTDKDIKERQAQIKEDFWGDLKSETLIAVKRLLETTMDVEVQDLAGARRWEHSTKRLNYRNGSYKRNLWTSYGWINSLVVPRLRSGRMSFKTFEKYQQRTETVNSLIKDMFLSGVSTRKVKEALKPLYGQNVISASTVSAVTKVLDAEVEKYHRRPIGDDYKFLFLDGIYLKAKSPVKARRRCILVAYGIKKDGTRELIDFRLARKGESQAAWECFLNSMSNRDFKGKSLELISVDGGKGIMNALDFIFPDVPKQRCWAHKLRNVANYLPKKLQKACTCQARDIYAAEGYGQAIKAFKVWAGTWRPVAPEAVECLETDLEDLLKFYTCPKAMWVKLRTTNIIERVFREVRRRTRPMSCFTNTKSVERIIFAIFNRQNMIWKEKPLKEITQNS
jgi:transposase-like protein